MRSGFWAGDAPASARRRLVWSGIAPHRLLADAISADLSPTVLAIRAEIGGVPATLKEAEQAILVIDKNRSAVLRLADRVVVLEPRHSV